MVPLQAGMPLLAAPTSPPLVHSRQGHSHLAAPTASGSTARQAAGSSFSSAIQGSSAAAFVGFCAGMSRRRPQRVQMQPFRRDFHLEGYPIHGPGYYWTISKNTEAVLIYMPVADDVNSKDVIFDCHDKTLKLGLKPEKGSIIINDKLIYKVDVNESYFLLDTGKYEEKCVVVWLEKLTKEQDWYAYDRFDPVTERFLLVGEKEKAMLQYKITKKAFLDVMVDDEPVGRITIGLYGEQAPRTVENFLCLCTGEKGVSKETGHPLHYKGTRFHRIIDGFCIQGGQTFEDEEGTGGESIYGLTFEDENLRAKFRKPWMLAMANGGPDSNGSQFFITTAAAEHLTHKYVGFGEVLDGVKVVQEIERLGDEEGDAYKDVVIYDCGALELDGSERTRVIKPESERPKTEMGEIQEAFMELDTDVSKYL